VIEFAKTAASVKSPVECVIYQHNPLLIDKPNLIYQDCYHKGYLLDVACNFAPEKFIYGITATAFLKQKYQEEYEKIYSFC
jgi:glycine cleavage system H lipoate-binding protein